MHAQWVETCSGYQLDATNDNLHKRVKQGLQGLAGAKDTQDTAPQVEAVDVLPVVHRLVCFLFPCVHGIAQVDGELADVEESMLVGNTEVQGKQLSQCSLHEADEGECTGRGELAIPHICDVHLLQDRIQKTSFLCRQTLTRTRKASTRRDSSPVLHKTTILLSNTRHCLGKVR